MQYIRSATPQAILEASHGRGRKKRLTGDEEVLIRDSIIPFKQTEHYWTETLSSVLDKEYVKTLPRECRKRIGFVSDRPGLKWFRESMKRYAGLNTSKTADIGHERAETMFPENVAAHLARSTVYQVWHKGAGARFQLGQMWVFNQRNGVC